ncbi:hypothetical protein ACH5RR_003571 [Cinchona calisaya]|uniref:Uncharacterized protein n=1 Tax=Cinchona calisaya TaxID=153742 RepID=A0ABD3AV85_9GENT
MEQLTLPNLAKVVMFFPPHYVYVWLAQYFNTHQPNPLHQPDSTMAKFSRSSSVISFHEISAKEYIMRGTNFVWYSTSFALEKQHIFTDGHNLSPFKFIYFMNLRSSEYSEELPASVLERIYQLYHSCTRTGTKSKVSVPALSRNFGGCLLDDIILASGSFPGSKADVEAIAMDKGTSSRKRCAILEVQDETPLDDHPNGHPSQQSQLDDMSDETPLIQRSQRLKKKFSSD